MCWIADQEVGVLKAAMAEIWLEISASPAPPAVSARLNTLTIHCQLEGEMARRGLATRPHMPEQKAEVSNAS